MKLGPLLLLLVIFPFSIVLASYGPNLLVIIAWLFTWLMGRDAGLAWALPAGLLLDAIGFTPFGVITLGLVTMVLVIDYLRNRFFEVSSFFEAGLGIAIAGLIWWAFQLILTRGTDLVSGGIGLIANVIVGLVLYYLLAVRFRLFQRWAGKRL